MYLLQVDGNKTLGENICDSGGLAHAWTAYKNSKSFDLKLEADLPGVNYTQDQLFFINYGQVIANNSKKNKPETIPIYDRCISEIIIKVTS